MGSEEGATAFGVWLGRQLRRRDMTQAELAAELGLTRAAVSAWITGRAEPREAVKRDIAEALGTDEWTVHSRTVDVPSNAPVSWYHRPAHADGGREFGNAAAFAFDADLSVLAREATQNSLDERLDTGRPVRVRHTLHELSGEHLRAFLVALGWDDLEPHYDAAAGRGQKVGRVLAEGLRQLRESGSLLLLRIDDYNATGLVGAEYGDSKFAAVARDQLNSNKSGVQAGGSYGLGKATLWGTSRIGLVLINSTLSEAHEGRTERRVIGRVELPWHTLGDEAFAGPAWLGETDPSRDGIARSWWADRETTKALHLERESAEPGTSFLVVGAHDAAGDTETLQDMHTKLVTALGENFWAAMTSGRHTAPLLEASVTTLRNGNVLVPEQRVDPHELQPGRARALQAYLNGETVDQLTGTHQVAVTRVPLRVPPLTSEGKRSGGGVEHHAIVLVTSADDRDKDANHLVCMRGNRMSVMERRVRDLPLGTNAFQAVLLAGLATGDGSPEARAAEAFLRAAEPPEHNDWNKTEDLAATYARGARTRITEFRKEMDEAVRRLVGRREEKREGGPAVLRELLRLDAPGAAGTRRAEGHPTIRHVNGRIDGAGAWHVSVEIKLPPRTDPWFLEPVAKFDVRSGGRPRVGWTELAAGENCVIEDGLLRCEAGVRSASFSGVTDVHDHPVAAAMARLVVDLQKARAKSA
ncbi:helix-turn-helix transcriptional regulator [Streptomyces xinghaiensis]|uniref:helix-turn-helix transcriptional regulator n=1 Tax=Streptomyces xinghaiensis TaxID=1038928 RepID=UPI002E11DA1A|nr:helix-turn-helix transcriptional regulator [Streptomyces xinghaiensis]